MVLCVLLPLVSHLSPTLSSYCLRYKCCLWQLKRNRVPWLLIHGVFQSTWINNCQHQELVTYNRQQAHRRCNGYECNCLGSTGCVIFSQPSYNLAPRCMFPSYPRSCLQGANAPWTNGPIFHRLLQCLSLEFPQSPRTGSQWANGALAWSDPNPAQRRRMLHMTNKLSLGTSGGEDYTATNGDGLTIMTCDNVRTN